jgi:N-acyl amino acid synthase of PEP-CTERM/exosortase system
VRLDENQADVYGRYFSVMRADTPELQQQVYRLRYQVYCIEHAFENPHDHFAEQEIDEYDCHSVHAVLVHRPSGSVCGCVRLILPGGGSPLPITRFVPDHAAAALPTRRMAEVSRYAVSKAFRRRTEESEYPDVHFGDLEPSELRRLVPHITVGLMLAVATLSEHCGISHLAAVMAPALLRLLRTCGMEFVTVGPLVEHHGVRQPCFAAVADLLAGVKAANPAYFEIIRRGLPRPSVYQADVTASTAYAKSNSQFAVGHVAPPQ